MIPLQSYSSIPHFVMEVFLPPPPPGIFQIIFQIKHPNLEARFSGNAY